MTDEQRLQATTEMLILVRDNLFRGMSKSIQKLQARSINEFLELPNYTESPQRPWVENHVSGLLEIRLWEAAQQPRQWVGLTEKDWEYVKDSKGTSLDTFDHGAAWAADQLMKRNT